MLSSLPNQVIQNLNRKSPRGKSVENRKDTALDYKKADTYKQPDVIYMKCDRDVEVELTNAKGYKETVLIKGGKGFSSEDFLSLGNSERKLSVLSVVSNQSTDSGGARDGLEFDTLKCKNSISQLKWKDNISHKEISEDLHSHAVNLEN